MMEEHMQGGQWPDVLKMHGMDVDAAEKRFGTAKKVFDATGRMPQNFADVVSKMPPHDWSKTETSPYHCLICGAGDHPTEECT